MELSEKANRLAEKLYTYAYMKRDEDSRISEFQKLALEVNSLGTRLSGVIIGLAGIGMSILKKKKRED